MKDQYSGSCMCGATRFSFTGEPRFVAECVCNSCRHAHGASAVCWVGVNTEHFRLDDPDSNLKWYHSSAEAQRGFCGQCGCTMFFRSEKWAGETHMARACIDAPNSLKATVISFPEELPDWTAMTVHT